MARELSEIYNLDVKDLRGILNIIIRDEEIHRKLLSKMKRILVGKEKQTEDIAPVFKYTNPDAWIHGSTLHSFTDTQAKENI